MLHTYYTPRRPPMPGAIPRAGLVEIRNYEGRRKVPGVERLVWGCAVYCRALRDDETRDYELIEGNYGGSPIRFEDIMRYADASGTEAAIDLMTMIGVDGFNGTVAEYEDTLDMLAEIAQEERAERGL